MHSFQYDLHPSIKRNKMRFQQHRSGYIICHGRAHCLAEVNGAFVEVDEGLQCWVADETTLVDGRQDAELVVQGFAESGLWKSIYINL